MCSWSKAIYDICRVNQPAVECFSRIEGASRDQATVAWGPGHGPEKLHPGVWSHGHHYRIATVVPWCNSHWILSLPPLLPHVSGIQIKTGNHSALMGVTTGQSLTVEPSPSPGLAGWVS